jgi:hypothetical protein
MQRWLAGMALFGTLGLTVAARSEASPGYPEGAGEHVGLVVQANAEYGGDNLVRVYYAYGGGSQDIKAGQGVTLAAGVHYQPASFPVDFTATVGYKFIRTRDYDSDLGINRVVFRFTGTLPLGNGFWVDAGPEWHTGIKFDGDGYLPNVNFDDAVGVTVGFGWRWIGLSYTNIRYKSPITESVDASNVGVTFAWKF